MCEVEVCSYEDKVVLGNPLTKWEGGIYSVERKRAVGDTLSHTRSGRPTVVGSPGVREGPNVRLGSDVRDF